MDTKFQRIDTVTNSGACTRRVKLEPCSHVYILHPQQNSLIITGLTGSKMHGYSVHSMYSECHCHVALNVCFLFTYLYFINWFSKVGLIVDEIRHQQ